VAFSGRINVDGNLGVMPHWATQRHVGVVTGNQGYLDPAGTLHLSGNGNTFFQQMATGHHTITLDSDTSKLAGQAATFDLFIKQPASGTACTLSWQSSFVWLTGSAPTLSSTHNAVDHIRVVTPDFVTFYAQHVNGS
jgi:hypothetical protein